MPHVAKPKVLHHSGGGGGVVVVGARKKRRLCLREGKEAAGRPVMLELLAAPPAA